VKRAPAILLAFLAAGQACAGAEKRLADWPDRYDEHFRKNAKHYFGPGMDWRWFKAQGIAESGLKPGAKNKTGARGIMQILPRTFEEIQEDNPHMKDIDSPRWNIAAGIYYDYVLYNRWKSPPPGEERLFFTFGSYNAGYSKIRKYFKQARPKTASWEEVEHAVPGQTRHYVRRIRRLMNTAAVDSGKK
jgi:soluble lytic murein transglycosylase-like protein